MTATASSLRALETVYRAEGFRPLPFASVADINTYAAESCPECGCPELGLSPFWYDDGRCRLIVLCQNARCRNVFEG